MELVYMGNKVGMDLVGRMACFCGVSDLNSGKIELWYDVIIGLWIQSSGHNLVNTNSDLITAALEFVLFNKLLIIQWSTQYFF